MLCAFQYISTEFDRFKLHSKHARSFERHSYKALIIFINLKFAPKCGTNFENNSFRVVLLDSCCFRICVTGIEMNTNFIWIQMTSSSRYHKWCVSLTYIINIICRLPGINCAIHVRSQVIVSQYSIRMLLL